jgi:mono/diheme cytochrome c family protein
LKKRLNIGGALTVYGVLAGFGAANAQIEEGRRIAESHCARCHAVGADGDSPHGQAPPFRELGQRYPVEGLEEALAEGIMTGHPDMPEFTLKPQEIGAFIDYLKSIQQPGRNEKQR